MDGGRPVLVIGGTRGTGLLIARLLAKRGDAVRVLARNPTRAKGVLPGGVDIVGGDVTNAETLRSPMEAPRTLCSPPGAAAVVRSASEKSARPNTRVW